ncbi:DUF3850 domain-containing protein [Achromobacter xylosoxidans]|uniref:DUF3850 domain-containing protein n=1 Tax=Alcaligenes xylosoxydans xylosoxydans TaxID=85698 RepID=UPI001231E9C1|nr:DUF3850 domain-containing protein [Achromobacter xylosoxidans]KAA5926383.1 DUF3850 domain-containing protein [Achromobacter xylosoxidans]
MTSHPDPNSAAQAQRDRYHILKTDPDVFQAVLSGAKTFEIRLNDRGYAVGDVLGLRETKHTGAEMRAGAPLEYTGRECQRFVSHVLTGYGLADGWCCLSFRLPHATGAGAPVAVPPAPAARTEQATGHDRLLRALATQEAKDGIGALDALYDLAVKHGASKTAAAGFAHVANGAFAALEGQVHDEIRRRSIVAQAIAPVAGEAQVIGYVPPLYLEMRRRGMPVNSKIQHSPGDDATAPLYTSPQSSAEYERGHADGWAAGWDQAIKQPQADKDGGQQRAGDECKHARAYRAGDRQGYACPDCGEFVSDYEIHRRQRAGDGKTREAVDYLRGSALNFDDPVAVGPSRKAILEVMRPHLDEADGGYAADTAPEKVAAAGRAVLALAALNARDTQAEQGEREDG